MSAFRLCASSSPWERVPPCSTAWRAWGTASGRHGGGTRSCRSCCRRRVCTCATDKCRSVQPRNRCQQVAQSLGITACYARQSAAIGLTCGMDAKSALAGCCCHQLAEPAGSGERERGHGTSNGSCGEDRSNLNERQLREAPLPHSARTRNDLTPRVSFSLRRRLQQQQLGVQPHET